MLFFFNTKKFSDPLNTSVFTTVYVMKENSPIMLVSHELNGDWQFMHDFFQIPKDQVESSCQLTQDCCIIDEEKFFVKGQINIVVDNNEEFRWTAWARISMHDFQRIQESWTNDNRVLEEPYEGYLATQLSCYADTLNLPLKVRSQKVGIIPKIEITDTSHPLFLEQECGITMDRVISFARQLIYNH